MQENETSMTEIDTRFNGSPCVGRCSTTYGDLICRGCKRYLTEIASWSSYSKETRTYVWQRLDALASKIIPEFVSIQEQPLEIFLKDHGIRYPAHLSSCSWAQHCIDDFPGQLSQLHQAGLQLIPTAGPFKDLRALQLAIQQAMYKVSEAQKERQEQLPQGTR